jgi:neutral ceramidase
MPVQVLRIGPAVLVGLPFEVTVEAGRRVQQSVAAVMGPAGIDRVAVSSLANEQFCYLTTPEEYSLQRYEGGNTLYGPQSQPFVAACAARLAADVVAAGDGAMLQDVPAARDAEFAARRYLARPSQRAVQRVLLGAPAFTDATRTEDGYWQLLWRDRAPGDLHWHESLARVEVRAPDGAWVPAVRDGRPVDDQGYHLGVVHLGTDAGGAGTYAARWYTPYLGPGAVHRFVLPANAAAIECRSGPFA